MPITPLHLAAALPVKRLAKEKFSLGAFIAVNILIDLEPAAVMFFGMDRLGYPLHGVMHTLLGVCLAILVIALFEWQWRWFAGSVYGGMSHLLMDATVHTDVEPFWPIASGNPLYLSIMEPLSLVCLLVILWYGVPWLLLRVREISGRLFR